MTHKTLTIAKWEFRTTVLRRAYFISVLLMPAIILGTGAITALTTPSAMRATAAIPIAVVDKPGILDVDFATAQAGRREELRQGGLTSSFQIPGGGLRVYSEEAAAIRDVTDGKASAVYVIEKDYVTSGHITAYGRSQSLLSQASGTQRQNQVADAIRASLLKQAVSGNVLDRIYAPATRLKRMTIDRTGQVKETTADMGVGQFAGTFGVFMLLTMAIFLSAGFLQQATIEDRQNRVFEVLLSSVDPDDLILGKIIGRGGAGLLQVGIYLVIILALGSSALLYITIPPALLALTLVYFAFGYLIYGSLMATVGMIARSAQESAQMSTIWTFGAIAPMFVITSISASPNGAIARTLSFFPLSSATTMLLRLTMTPDVAVVDIVISIVVCAVSVYLAVKGAVKIFRATTLMYGKRPSLPELIHWLRA